MREEEWAPRCTSATSLCSPPPAGGGGGPQTHPDLLEMLNHFQLNKSFNQGRLHLKSEPIYSPVQSEMKVMWYKWESEIPGDVIISGREVRSPRRETGGGGGGGGRRRRKVAANHWTSDGSTDESGLKVWGQQHDWLIEIMVKSDWTKWNRTFNKRSLT